MKMANVKNRSTGGVDGDVRFLMQSGLFYDGMEEDLANDKKLKQGRLQQKHYTRSHPLRIVQVEIPEESLVAYRDWKKNAETSKHSKSKSRAYRASRAMANLMVDALLNNNDIYFRLKQNKK